MMAVHGINTLAGIVEENNRIENAEKEIRKARINELMAQGIDKTVATVMVDSFTSCGVFGY